MKNLGTFSDLMGDYKLPVEVGDGVYLGTYEGNPVMIVINRFEYDGGCKLIYDTGYFDVVETMAGVNIVGKFDQS